MRGGEGRRGEGRQERVASDEREEEGWFSERERESERETERDRGRERERGGESSGSCQGQVAPTAAGGTHVMTNATMESTGRCDQEWNAKLLEFSKTEII